MSAERPVTPMDVPEPEIIYEDPRFVAVCKPSGMLVHPVPHSKGADAQMENTLVGWILERYPEVEEVGDDPGTRPGIVHRLDRETSGVMVVARNQEYFEYLKSLFQSRSIRKTYVAAVFDVPKEDVGTIDAPIGIKNGTVRRSVHARRMAKPAVTDYRVMSTAEGSFSLLELHPRTGRTHQIRVHLSSRGHPVVGDMLYAEKRNRLLESAMGPLRLMLHAASLEFDAEPGTRMVVEKKPDDGFLDILRRLGLT